MTPLGFPATKNEAPALRHAQHQEEAKEEEEEEQEEEGEEEEEEISTYFNG